MSNYPNMSYCMYENTLHAMRQVMDDLEERDSIDGKDEYDEKLSETELASAKSLLTLCRRMVDEFDDGGDSC